jgi:hypothetical protein
LVLARHARACTQQQRAPRRADMQQQQHLANKRAGKAMASVAMLARLF